MQVMCLSDNTSWFSALANDEGYDTVFAGQLENFAKPGDVLVCISASGNSPNLMRASTWPRSEVYDGRRAWLRRRSAQVRST